MLRLILHPCSICGVPIKAAKHLRFTEGCKHSQCQKAPRGTLRLLYWQCVNQRSWSGICETLVFFEGGKKSLTPYISSCLTKQSRLNKYSTLKKTTTLETQQLKMIQSNICDNRPKYVAVSKWETKGEDWREITTTKPTCTCIPKHLKIHPKSIPLC